MTKQDADALNWHPSVVAMANSMQEKLDKNAHKKGWPTKTGKRGWIEPHCNKAFLLEKLEEEVNELLQAVDFLSRDIRQGKTNEVISNSRDNVRLEAADVANIAMMIADNLDCL